MRRLLAIACLLCGAVAFVALSTGATPDDGARHYSVVFDNAFGLIEGGDLKIAGVRAGKIEDLRLDRRTKRAVVDFKVTERGFGSLRRDVHCEILPQSLVGEYYVDCQPGTARQELPEGSTIPVEQTSTVVPPDLVGNIMRRPVRERFRFILGELGAAVAGNAENLNAAIRRASPALRETNRVLAILARQNQVLADLTTNADHVLVELARKKREVARFIVEARDTAQASAERDRDLAAGWRRLPVFLRELRPTMRDLGRSADAQGPALRKLAQSGDELERLFDNLEPFAEASRPSLRSLGEAGRIGEKAAKVAGPTVAELNRYAEDAPELGRNLAITLEHLDNREYSAERDPRSPGGKGYTGLEALLQYVFDQTLSINIYDGESHILKAIPFESVCGPYADKAKAKELREQCSTELGPNRFGFEIEDPSAPPNWDGADRGSEEKDASPKAKRSKAARRTLAMPSIDEVLPAGPSQRSTPGAGPRPEAPLVAKLPDVPVRAPRVDAPRVAPRVDAQRPQADETQLLDYLLGG